MKITPLTTIEQFKDCEKLQQIIWQADPIDIIPADLLISAQRHGGLVLGAFEPSGRMIGCLFGFTGYASEDNPLIPEDHLIHCSHLVGVTEEWRGKNVGFLLKRAQREWALAHQFEWIAWTYNPIEIANATLNIGKLGALCCCYLRNMYGSMPNKLNEGLLTDRFEVAWQLKSPHVIRRVEEGWTPPLIRMLLQNGAQILNPARISPGQCLEPSKVIDPPKSRQVLVEIPTNIQQIRDSSSDLALAWQLHTREAFETIFCAGYITVDVVRDLRDGFPRAYYLAERE